MQKVGPADVKMQPYPHVVVKEALPWDVYNKLAAVYPSDQTIVSIAQGDGKVNTRIAIPTTQESSS